MSWNGSDSVMSASRADRDKHTRRNGGRGERPARPLESRSTHLAPRITRHGLLAGLIVVALGALAVWFFVGRTPTPTVVEKKHSSPNVIAEVKPALVTNKSEKILSARELKAEKHREYIKKLDASTYVDDKGVRRYPGGLRYMGPNAKIHQVKDTRPPPRFKRYSSGRIATLLELTPGEIPVGGMQFPSKFDEDFKASLAEEIEILDTDSDDLKELKKAVVKTKQDLAERMKNGESPREICEATWNELQEIGLYRNELIKQVNAIRNNPDMSAEDIQDAVEAANIMLKEKGIKGIGISKIALKRLANRKKAQKQ